MCRLHWSSCADTFFGGVLIPLRPPQMICQRWSGRVLERENMVGKMKRKHLSNARNSRVPEHSDPSVLPRSVPTSGRPEKVTEGGGMKMEFTTGTRLPPTNQSRQNWANIYRRRSSPALQLGNRLCPVVNLRILHYCRACPSRAHFSLRFHSPSAPNLSILPALSCTPLMRPQIPQCLPFTPPARADVLECVYGRMRFLLFSAN